MGILGRDLDPLYANPSVSDDREHELKSKMLETAKSIVHLAILARGHLFNYSRVTVKNRELCQRLGDA